MLKQGGLLEVVMLALFVNDTSMVFTLVLSMLYLCFCFMSLSPIPWRIGTMALLLRRQVHL